MKIFPIVASFNLTVVTALLCLFSGLIHLLISNFNTDPVGNSTSVDQEGQLEPGVIALADSSKAVNQDETNNAEESTKPNKP